MMLLECNPDEFVVRKIRSSKVKHVMGKGNVLGKVRKNPGTLSAPMGID